jgi:hypothetical protein
LNNSVGIIVFVIFAIVALAVVIISAQLQKKRTEALRATAARMGWDFNQGPFDGGGGWLDGRGRSDEVPYMLFDTFQQGHSREFRNVMAGEVACGARNGQAGVGLACEAGDFKWVTGSGKNKRTHRRSYFLFDFSDDLGVTPSLVIRPEGLGDRIMGVFGGGDIDFESDEFSRRFHVTSSDKRFAFAVIDPRMMEFLMENPSLSLLINGGWGMLVSESGEWDPQDFSWSAGWVKEFIEHWPDYLVRQCREGSWR